jgi:hypothetical protein
MLQAGEMARRCAWCNRAADNLKEVTLLVPDRLGMRPTPRPFYVLPEHEQALSRFVDRARRFGVTFVLSMTALSIATVMAAAMDHRFIGLFVGLMGLLLIIFPFATPQLVNAVGVRTSITFVRVAGIGLIGFAVYLALTLH